MEVFCSTIIATIGRPSLARTVESVLAQACPAAFEVIVVNDSGQPLPPAGWHAHPRVRLLTTARRERCVARNAGAAAARGAYLHFLDDDDYLLPGALQAWHAAVQAAPAHWYTAASQLVNRAGQPTLVHRPNLAGNAFVEAMAGEWLPLPSSIIQAEAFFAAGGFDPASLYVEDNDLARRITLRGPVCSVPAVVACLALGEANSTSDSQLRRAHGWATREKLLADAACFARLRAGTPGAYMRGRVVRCYATSAVWNGRQGRVATALSRASWAGLALLLAARHWLAPDFWRAIARPYASPIFAAGQPAAPVPGPLGEAAPANPGPR